MLVEFRDGSKFLSTPSARRATRSYMMASSTHEIFLSTPSARRATCCPGGERYFHKDFYPRPPRGGRPAILSTALQTTKISIHALREEGDLDHLGRFHRVTNFYPRLPRGGRRAVRCGVGMMRHDFYPHPPRGGRLAKAGCSAALRCISIPTLREEGDLCIPCACWLWLKFLSPPSARRATQAILNKEIYAQDFYPHPPRGGRRRRF